MKLRCNYSSLFSYVYAMFFVLHCALVKTYWNFQKSNVQNLQRSLCPYGTFKNILVHLLETVTKLKIKFTATNQMNCSQQENIDSDIIGYFSGLVCNFYRILRVLVQYFPLLIKDRKVCKMTTFTNWNQNLECCLLTNRVLKQKFIFVVFR